MLNKLKELLKDHTDDYKLTKAKQCPTKGCTFSFDRYKVIYGNVFYAKCPSCKELIRLETDNE
jgi:hypothetical protein